MTSTLDTVKNKCALGERRLSRRTRQRAGRVAPDDLDSIETGGYLPPLPLAIAIAGFSGRCRRHVAPKKGASMAKTIRRGIQGGDLGHLLVGDDAVAGHDMDQRRSSAFSGRHDRAALRGTAGIAWLWWGGTRAISPRSSGRRRRGAAQPRPRRDDHRRIGVGVRRDRGRGRRDRPRPRPGTYSVMCVVGGVAPVVVLFVLQHRRQPRCEPQVASRRRSSTYTGLPTISLISSPSDSMTGRSPT